MNAKRLSAGFVAAMVVMLAMLAMLIVPTLSSPMLAAAQAGVTSADIQRLQDEVYQASTDVSRFRDHRMHSRQDACRMTSTTCAKEVIYLKVKLRKENNVSRSRTTQVRDQLQDLRARARGDARGAAPVDSPTVDRTGPLASIPALRRPRSMTIARAAPPLRGAGFRPGRRSTSGPRPSSPPTLRRSRSVRGDDGRPISMRGIASWYRPARSCAVSSHRSIVRRADRKGSLTVNFDPFTVGGRNYPMRGTVTDSIESSGIKGEVGRIGTGSAVGAIIGGVIGGVKGALLGVLIGGGGTMVATEGKDVRLPPARVLRVRMDTPPEIY